MNPEKARIGMSVPSISSTSRDRIFVGLPRGPTRLDKLTMIRS
jgi:hypothetical protein